MKNIKTLLVISILTLSPLILFAAQTLFVQVRTGQIRTTPSFLGKPLASLCYKSTVTLLKQKGDWMQITTPGGISGWMHRTELISKEITMTVGNSDVKSGTSDAEIALAGKGFNSDVEANYKIKNANADFTSVDKLEGYAISIQEMEKFLLDGNLKTGGAR